MIRPSKIKKAVYLLSTMVLGILLSFLVHAAIEMNYLNWLASRGEVARFYSSCVLPPLLQGTLWLGGIIGGWFLGQYWWRKVYIERFWARFFKKYNK